MADNAVERTRDRARLDAQRERVVASDEPIPYVGREHEPGQQVAGGDPSLHTGRGESIDMEIDSADVSESARLRDPIPAAAPDEEYEVADRPTTMLTTEEKLGLDHGAPGAIRDPASPGVGPISNFLFLLIAALVVFAIAYLIYQNV